MGDMQRVARYLAQSRWFRQASSQGQFGLGGAGGHPGKGICRQEMVITFDPQRWELIC
jgi:hypothetical protein